MKFIICYANITAVFSSYEFAMHKKEIDYKKNMVFKHCTSQYPIQEQI